MGISKGGRDCRIKCDQEPRDAWHHEVVTVPVVAELIKAFSISHHETPTTLERHDPAPNFAALEERLADSIRPEVGLRYPTAIRELYRYVFPTIDCGVIRFVPSPQGDATRALGLLVTHSYEPSEVAGQGLLAIAEDGNDGGPLCLDTTRGDEPDTWPVVLWDHDQRTISEVLYSSATGMVACATHMRRGGPVSELASIDPAGAAADYYAFWDD